MKNILKIFILLILSSSLAGLSLSCKKQPTPTPTPSASITTETPKNDLTNLDSSSIIDEIKSNYALSREKAAAWQSDAVLYSASAKISSTLNQEDTIEVYTFGSPLQPAYWWTISISVRSKNYVRAIIPKEDYLGSSLRSVMTQYWKINYVEAFQVAEKNGGKEWRQSQNDSNYQITTTLVHGDPKGYLYWMVEYQDSSGADKKTVQVNANNGEVIKQES